MENNEKVTDIIPEEEVEESEVDELEEECTSEDYKLMIDLLKEMEEEYKILKDYSSSRIRSEYNLDPEIISDILCYTKEDIENKLTLEEMREFCKRYYLKTEMTMDLVIGDIIKSSKNDEEHGEITTEEEAYRRLLLDIKEDSLNIYNTKQQIKNLKDQSSDILKEYFTYLSSKEVRQKKLENLEIMKAQVEKESDELSKKKLLKKIEDMEAAYSLSFLFTRIDKYGKKELESIKNAFFDKTKGSYIIEKYKSKIESFGFKDRLFRYFFNIEENFLPEKYHAYNNLYLFFYMRMVAFSDSNDRSEKMFVQAITSSMANLIYHRFDDKTNEDEFISVIERLLDRFEEYHDYFEKYNKTQPKHPMRIEATKKREAERIKMLTEKMDQMGIEGYPEDACADDLQNYLNEAIEKMVQEQTKDGINTNIEELEDGSVSITPKMETEEKNDEE